MMSSMRNSESDNALENVNCVEVINYERLQELLKYAPHCKEFNDKQKEQIISLAYVKYAKQPSGELGQAQIRYAPKSANRLGRVYHKVNGKALQQQSKNVRHILCHKNNGECLYIDIDIVNCHPVLIIQMCKVYKIPCDVIETYVKDRECILKQVMTKHKCSRSQAKKLFIRLLYSGKWDNWFAEFDLSVVEPLPFVKAFYHQMRDICERFYTHIDFSHNRQEAINKMKRKPEYFVNPEATCLSYIIAERENLILWNMRRFFINQGLQVSVLVYDGLMVRNDGTKVEKMFDDCANFIKESTQFDVLLETKPLETTIDWDDIVDKLKNGVLDKSKVSLGEWFDVSKLSKITSENAMDEYLMKKYYFEHWIKFSVTHKCYFVKNKYELTSNSVTSLKDLLGMKAVKTRLPKNKNECWKFIDYYFTEDNSNNDYQGICYTPYNPFLQKDVDCGNRINKFGSYKYNILPREEVDYSRDYIWNFRRHAKRFCEGRKDILHYFLSLLAWKVVEPTFQAGVAMVIKSREEGAGKSCMMMPFRNIFGVNNVKFHHTLGQYCGRFSMRCGECLITVIDELKQDRSDNACMEQLMSDITCEKLQVEPKNIMPYEVENCSLIMCFCNKLTLKVNTSSSSSRRWLATIFDESDLEYDIKSPEYKQWLMENIIVFQNDKNAWSQLFWFLNDYPKMTKQELRTVPMTKGMMELRNVNARHEQIFLHNFLFIEENHIQWSKDIGDGDKLPDALIDGDVVLVNRKRLNQCFQHQGYVKNKLLEATKGIQFVQSKKVNGGRCYRFQLSVVKKSLSFIL